MINFQERTEVNPNNEHLHQAEFPDHWERYFFAAKYITGGSVIDIACGPGYGTAFLSKFTNSRVLGLDIDESTIKIAQKNYGAVCDFIKIIDNRWPFENSSINFIVSLETFEHINEIYDFLDEAYRVLSPGGFIVFSTPLNETESRFKPENPFHIREYSWDEFGEIISTRFVIKNRFSQISKLGSINSKIEDSYFNKIKLMLPNTLKSKILQLLNKKMFKSGNILEGKVKNASVQLILCTK
jgi:ubiquinone/menaquinone biosynthesis C-methylase UbiE